MNLLSFDEFIFEERVSLKKGLKEYTLTHNSADRFNLKSKDFSKDFSILPYKKESIEKFRDVHIKLINAINSKNTFSLYSALKLAESIPYNYGNVFPLEFSLSQIPDLMSSLDDNQKNDLKKSEREFMLNIFSHLNKDVKSEVEEVLEERTAVTCAIIEALFYYIRLTDKENFYDGKSSDEILEIYQAEINKCKKDFIFTVKGPYNDQEKQNDLKDDDAVAYWHCTKNENDFIIKGTISPKELYSEENIGGIIGLKFSLISKKIDDTDKQFSFFNIEELLSRLKIFSKKFKQRNGKH